MRNGPSKAKALTYDDHVSALNVADRSSSGWRPAAAWLRSLLRLCVGRRRRATASTPDAAVLRSGAQSTAAINSLHRQPRRTASHSVTPFQARPLSTTNQRTTRQLAEQKAGLKNKAWELVTVTESWLTDSVGFNGTFSTNGLYRAFHKYVARLKKWN